MCVEVEEAGANVEVGVDVEQVVVGVLA